MRRFCFCVLLCGWLLLSAHALADTLALSAPEAIKPYENTEIVITAPEGGELTLTLGDGVFSYQIARLAVQAGETRVSWDGLGVNGEAVIRGAYTLTAALTGEKDTYACERPLRVRAPAAALQYVIPSDDTVYADSEGFLVNYLAAAEGLLHVKLYAAAAPEDVLRTWGIQVNDTLPHIFSWNGQIDYRNVPSGEYVLTFGMKNSPQAPLSVRVTVSHAKAPTAALAVTESGLYLPETLDDTAAVWRALMAPVAVVNIGDLAHQKIYASPDTGSEVLGTVHGRSQALIIKALDQAGGFALVGAWRHEDGAYIEGYVPQSKLYCVIPNAHYGVVIDKVTQMLYVYRDGEKLGGISVSTGLMDKDKLFRETRAGAFLTTDRIITFDSEGFSYDYAIRIDGGNLIHSLGYKRRDGVKRDLSIQLQTLGQKASHGCVRMDTRAGEAGLNAYWLWTNIPYDTKVLVLDDQAARESRLAALYPTPTPSLAPTLSPAPDPNQTPAPTDMPTDAPDFTPSPAPAFSGYLNYKSRGLAVLQLQERLAALGYYKGSLDGKFGDGTRRAVVAFQRASKLDADGIVGEITFNALFGEQAVAAATAAPTDTPAPTKVPTPSPDPTPTPTPSPTPPPPPDETTLSLTFAGDCVLGSEEKYRKNELCFDSVVALKGYEYPFSGVKALFAADDLTTVNLECVLKDDANNKMPDKLFNFRGPTAFAGMLPLASVEHVNVANNHFIDYGTAGRKSTLAALDTADVKYSGYTNLYVFEKDGVKIGFGGIRETTFHQNRQTMTDDIRALKAQGCDFIIYSCHFGKEYARTHNENQTLMAHMAIDAGANVVMGAHPHVVQGIEEYNGGVIFYSLGNLVFGGNLNLTEFDALVVRLDLHFTLRQCDDIAVTLHPVLTSTQNPGNDFCPVPAQGEDYERILQKVQDDSALTIAGVMRFGAGADEPAATGADTPAATGTAAPAGADTAAPAGGTDAPVDSDFTVLPDTGV